MADMSFLPEDYVEKRAHRRTNVICMVLFVIIMGGVVGAYYVTDKQRMEVRQQREQVNQRFQEAARRLAELEELQRQKMHMLRKATITGALLERLPRSLLLSQLINTMPRTMSLFEMELQTKALRPQGPRPRTAIDRAKRKAKNGRDADGPSQPVQIEPVEITLALVGVARTDVEVAQFMTGLKQTPLFESVNLAYSEEVKIDEQPMRKFRVELIVNQNVDLSHYEPVMVQRLKQNPMDDRVRFDEKGRLVNPTRGGVVSVPTDRPRLKD